MRAYVCFKKRSLRRALPRRWHPVLQNNTSPAQWFTEICLQPAAVKKLCEEQSSVHTSVPGNAVRSSTRRSVSGFRFATRRKKTLPGCCLAASRGDIEFDAPKTMRCVP